MTYSPTARESSSYGPVANGDDENAASVDVMLEGLADDASWSKEGGAHAALNWDTGGATVHNLKRLAFCARDGRWFGVSNVGVDSLEASKSHGRAWTDLAGSLGVGLALLDVAAASAGTAPGDVVILTGARDVYRGTRSAFATVAFALVSLALAAIPTGGAIEYEPTAGRFVACYRHTTSGHYVDTSPDGSTWLNRTLPAAWTSYTGTNDPELGAAPGRLVAIFVHVVGAALTFEVMYSTNGGTTWTGVTFTGSGISEASPKVTRPAYDPNTGSWWFCVSATASDATEVWASTDGGATWAIVALFVGSDVEVTSACMVGPVWAMVTKKGRVLASKDGGATWRWVANHDGTTGIFVLRGGGGGALVTNATDKTSWHSVRAGRVPGSAV